MNSKTIKSIAIGAITCLASPAYSATAISSLTGETAGTGSGSTDHVVVGYDIIVGSTSIWVTALGYYDPTTPSGEVRGLQDPTAQVGIYDLDPSEPNGILLGSVVAGDSTTTFEEDYRFIELASPIQLLANTTYRVVANTGSVDGSSHNTLPSGGTPTSGEGLTVTSNWYFSGGTTGLVKANNPAPSALYLGNFQYSTTIPEPSVALLGVLSLGGLLRRRR